jgi:galactokinase
MVEDHFARHIDRLRKLPEHADTHLRTLFAKKSPIFIARAPGRLDIMGGIGDYSGSLVLELPVAEAALAAVQNPTTDDVIVVSLPDSGRSNALVAEITSQQWSDLRAGDYDAARQFFAQDPNMAWAAYVVGPVLVLLRETLAKLDGGMRILIDSSVPEGKGVSSSAAVEVATMRAAAAMLGIDLPAEELARLCQLAENHIVGAPCGIMDQMTSALGRECELLALRCQPAIVEGFVPIPSQIAFWGIDSGIRHAVSGSDYSSVRCGAFMGYRMVAEAAGLQVSRMTDDPTMVSVNDPNWNGYLANLTPQEFHRRFTDSIPEQISGRDFLDRFGGTTDHATRVDPSRTYNLLAPTLHPIEENQRADQFRTLLHGPTNESALREMGQLMFAAHDSYTACGLASTGTDLLVKLVREAGLDSGLYGAKITGGGSGGTVAVLGRSGAGQAVDAIARRYAELAGHETYVFRGSSPGAYGTPVQEVII